jgi:hypothetical protein
MVLDAPRITRVLPREISERFDLAQRLLYQFARNFLDLEYKILWVSDTVNAQAVEILGRRIVKLYGGLARHPAMGQAGLAVALAHETGHHLGGAPFDQLLPWLSSEQRADEWAETVGLPLVFGRKEASSIVKRGQREIADVKGSIGLQFY